MDNISIDICFDEFSAGGVVFNAYTIRCSILTERTKLFLIYYLN